VPKETWIIASILVVAALLGILALSSCHQSEQLKLAEAQAAEAKAAAAKSATEAADLKDKLTEAQTRIEELQKEKDSAAQTHKDGLGVAFADAELFA
jgi:septal ring factor EnvC (AmiA/AmiB activator)